MMNQKGKMTRREACYFLGIGENASEEQIKRAYRYKAKLYHPDANPDGDTKEYYIKVQDAYEYLINNPNTVQPSTAKAQPAGSNTGGWQYNTPFAASPMGQLPIQRIQPAQDQQRFMQVRLRQKPVIKDKRKRKKNGKNSRNGTRNTRRIRSCSSRHSFTVKNIPIR